MKSARWHFTKWRWGIVVLIILAMFFGWKMMEGGKGVEHHHEMPAAPSSKTLYQCPMHPQVVRDKPGNCPICGMRLTRMEREEGRDTDHGTSHPPEGEEGMVDGHAKIHVSAERRQLIGLKTTVAKLRPLGLEVRASGHVAYDPELYQAILEYQETVAMQQALKRSSLPEIGGENASLYRAAQLKLRQWGGSGRFLATLLGDRAKLESLILPGGTAWIYADIFEYEANLVRPGQTVKLTTSSLPNQPFRGTIVSMDPILDAATRTLRARILAPNRGGMLRPEMFVDVDIDIPLGTRLTIPSEAVIHSGKTQLVFIDKGKGQLIPRNIGIGYEANGYYEVLSGLSSGEKIVSSANFLIDSESRLQAAAQKFGPSVTTHQH